MVIVKLTRSVFYIPRFVSVIKCYDEYFFSKFVCVIYLYVHLNVCSTS